MIACLASDQGVYTPPTAHPVTDTHFGQRDEDGNHLVCAHSATLR